MPPVKALLALAATATAQTITASDQISQMAEAGQLSGAVSVRVAPGLSAQDAEDAVQNVATAMGVGVNKVTRAFSSAGVNEAAHRDAGLDEFYTFAATADGQTYPVADKTTRRLTVGAGSEVVDAFAMFQATPSAFDFETYVNTIQASGVVKFEGFLPDEADESLILGSRPKHVFPETEASANRKRVLTDVVPDDSMYDQQTDRAIMDTEGAWAVYPPAGSADVVVNIVDSGLFIDHEEFSTETLWHNPGEICGNGIDDDDNGYVDDCYGYNFADNQGNDNLMGSGSHGTHCAGNIAATRNNGVGIAGICGGDGSGNACRLQVGTCFGQTNTGGFAAAIVYGADNGAHVSSNSWGYTAPGFMGDAEQAAIEYANAAGVIVVFAAGNGSDNGEWYPAYMDETVAVACTNDNGIASSFTNYGSWIDISAVGEAQLSTVQGGYDRYSGTSMACPAVAGFIGLCFAAAGGSLGRDDKDYVMECLLSTAESIDDSNSGYGDGNLGAGMIKGGAFVSCCANGAPSPGPTVTMTPTVSPTPHPTPDPTISHAPTVYVPYVPGTFAILSDNYPSESAWTMTMTDPKESCMMDTLSGTVANLAAWHYYEFTKLCANDEYTLELTDAYGDGICCGYGEGSMNLVVGGETVWDHDGVFGSSAAVTFTVPGEAGPGNPSPAPTPAPSPAPSPAPTTSCADSASWHRAGKPTQDCDWVERKNEKKDWKKKKVKRLCKKANDDGVRASEDCACSACDMDRVGGGGSSEGSVEIIVPCVVGGVLLLGGIAILMRRRVLKALQHRRASMPEISNKALDIPAPGDE